ncbi:hypothetical protein BMS3Bbin09_00184 [bacterium BMS3Bbin09]|nr:hypothetical protein BMS3Bbin09_00184 [bacterium BMS3Bbin09]
MEPFCFNTQNAVKFDPLRDLSVKIILLPGLDPKLPVVYMPLACGECACITFTPTPELLLQAFFEDSNIRKVPEFVFIVESVTHKVVVRYFISHIVELDIGLSLGLFVEEHAYLQRGGLSFEQHAMDMLEGEAGVRDVIYKKDVLAVDLFTKVGMYLDLSSGLGLNIA